MSKPFDAASKYLLDLQPAAWSRWFGYTSNEVKVCNVDLSTISASADAMLLIGKRKKETLHIEFQSRYDKQLGVRTLI